jgi:hypothetical protein
VDGRPDACDALLMAWAYVQTHATASGLAAYDAIAAELGDEPPPGRLAHVAGLVDGRLRVIEVWETEAAFRRFREERLRPAMDRAVGPGVFSETWPPEGLEPMDVHALASARLSR